MDPQGCGRFFCFVVRVGETAMERMRLFFWFHCSCWRIRHGDGFGRFLFYFVRVGKQDMVLDPAVCFIPLLAWASKMRHDARVRYLTFFFVFIVFVGKHGNRDSSLFLFLCCGCMGEQGFRSTPVGNGVSLFFVSVLTQASIELLRYTTFWLRRVLKDGSSSPKTVGTYSFCF